MQKLFSQDKYNEIIEKCNDFKQRYVDSNETEVYLQLVHESDGVDGLRVTFDIYPKRFLDRLMDYALTPRLPRIPLFSYSFTTKVGNESYKYKEYRALAQENNGWLKAKLCDENESDFFGQLIWQCGSVICEEIGLKIQGSISSTDMRKINKVASGFDKKGSSMGIPRKDTNEKRDSESLTSYDIDLYVVGNANTSLITNNRTAETLLIDCGIERDNKYRNLYLQAENEIKMLDPDCILLSHNHEDHYNLLFCSGAAQSIALGLTGTKLKQVIVTGNHQGSLSQTIIRGLLGSKLVVVNPTIQNYQCTLTSAFPNIFINFGICPDLNSCVGGLQSSLENDTGIIVSIMNNKNIVFTGDCSFDFIPLTADLSDADYIVMPHHGGKSMMNNIISLKPNCIPIVSSGFTSLFPKSSVNYQAQYDQGLFLQKCGVTSPMLFLKSIQNSHYTINNV